MMLKHITFPETWLKNNAILLVESGSRAYGTQTEDSDYDYKGVVIPPLHSHYFGNESFKSKHLSTSSADQSNTKHDVDLVLYSIKQYMYLLKQANPNVLENLFVEPDNIVIKTELGERLIDNRHLFLTNHIANSYGGFATQLKRRIERDILETKRYNTKDLAHVLRIYETGIEAFKTGMMSTRRENADGLRNVRNGIYAPVDALSVMKILERQFKEAKAESVLPDEVDHDAVNELTISITSDFFGIDYP